MALRDQPYLPLYIQDFLTDEKLNECSASATGVYIRIMCLMHKSASYGTILLKQKDKQSTNQINNFALKLAKLLPWDVDVVLAGLEELLQEEVIRIEGDFLIQKRMQEDGELSVKRSVSGKKGGENTQKKNKHFAKAKTEANTEVENESIIIGQLEEVCGRIKEDKTEYFMYLVVEMIKIFMASNPGYFFEKEADYSACLQIAYHIAAMKNWKKSDVVNGKLKDALASWQTIVDFIQNDEWLRNRSLSDLSTVKEWQRLVQKMTNSRNDPPAGKKMVV